MFRSITRTMTRLRPRITPRTLVFGTAFTLTGFGLGQMTPVSPFQGLYHDHDHDHDLSTSPLHPPMRYADDDEFSRALTAIIDVVGASNVSRDDQHLQSVSDLFFSTHHPPKPELQRPKAIVSPKDTQEVSQIAAIAHKYRVPIVANSGMTSLEGHTMHTRGPNSIAVSFARMDDVIEFHPHDLDVTLQPGVGWQDLDEYLQEHGPHLMFGPDPGMGATIGGMIASSASGTNAYKYGTMKENVVNLTVVLADGTIVKTRQRPRKTSGGYDLTRLFIGLEGTLGLITEATVKLQVKPQYESVSIASFDTIKDATSMAADIVAKSGLQLNAIEIVDKTMVSFVNNHGNVVDTQGKKKQFIESPSLLMKIGGPSSGSIDEQVSLVKQIAKNNNSTNFELSHDEDEKLLLWGARRNGLWSTIDHGKTILEDGDDVQVWTTDIAVPLSNISQVISDTHNDLNQSGFQDQFATMGHIGDGNCHFLIVYNTKNYSKVQQAVDRMVFRALQYQGTCSGEHGVGIGKRKYLITELGSQAVDLMRHIKFLLDPRGILNPDKIFALDTNDDLDDLLQKGIKEQGWC